jgi:hypothetical protein
MAAALISRRRVLVPLVLAVACLVVSGWVGEVASLVLLFACFALFFDAALAAFPGSAMSEHRQ